MGSWVIIFPNTLNVEFWGKIANTGLEVFERFKKFEGHMTRLVSNPKIIKKICKGGIVV